MMTYEAALSYLYALTDYEQKSPQRYAPENFDLERMEHLLSLLGSPHKELRTVHVAGTKGKGSTSAMVASILESQGYRVGLYTSPHLHTFRERIRTNGHLIAPSEVADLADEIKPFADQVSGITTFEVITALALCHYRRKRVDIAVLEVGLGGRLDATNVVVPEVSVITSLSYDHVALLGNTLTDIAREKAGIIKPGVPVVSSPQQAEALSVLAAVCQEKGCRFTLVGRDWTWARGEASLDGQRFELCCRAAEDRFVPSRPCLSLWLPLLGEHQVVNATTAVATAATLRNRGWSVTKDAVALGLHRVYWPGRLEILNRRPMLVVDSAHNADSAQKLMQALRQYFGSVQVILIFGASHDKDIDGMLREFIPNVQEIILTRSDHARAADPEQLQAQVLALGGQGKIVESIDAALEMALRAGRTRRFDLRGRFCLCRRWTPRTLGSALRKRSPGVGMTRAARFHYDGNLWYSAA